MNLAKGIGLQSACTRVILVAMNCILKVACLTHLFIVLPIIIEHYLSTPPCVRVLVVAATAGQQNS